jgi:hypothetical protein
MKLEPAEKQVFQRPFARPVWWTLFLLATFFMSLWFQTFKTFTLTPTLQTGLTWLVVMAVLVAIVTLMIYDSYVYEWQKGQIQKPMALFEWMIRQRFLLHLDAQPKNSQQKETME